MKKIDLSIVIPCHNNSTTLNWILQAIRASSLQNLEILCIDDASTESIQQIAVSYDAKYFSLSNETHGRRSLARSLGHSLSKGKITLYIDGDVIPEPRLFEYAIKIHKHNKKSVVKYPVYSLPEHVHKYSIESLAELIIAHKLAQLGPYVTKHVGIDTRPLPRRLRGEKTNLWVLCASHCTSFEWQEVESAGGWDEAFRGWGEEDLELAYRLHKTGNKFIYPHRNHGAAYHLDHTYNWDARLKSLQRNILYFRSKHPDSWIGRKGLLRMFLEENNLPKTVEDFEPLGESDA